jgi:hypothetical protein
MKTNKQAAVIATLLTGSLLLGVVTASGFQIQEPTPVADYHIDEGHQIVKSTIEKAIQIQTAAAIPWLDAANLAVSLQPGGGHDLRVVDDIVIYSTDEVCLGGWLEGLEKIRVTQCVSIDWPAYLPE